jgi:hypothetical protein
MSYDEQRDGFLLNDEIPRVYGWSIYDVYDNYQWDEETGTLPEHEPVPGFYLHFGEFDAEGGMTLCISQTALQEMLSEIRVRLHEDSDEYDVAYGS